MFQVPLLIFAALSLSLTLSCKTSLVQNSSLDSGSPDSLNLPPTNLEKPTKKEIATYERILQQMGVRKDGKWKLLQIQSDASGKLSLVLVDIANAGVSGTTSLFRVTEGAVEELITGEITLFGWSWNEVYYVDHIHPNPGQSIEQVIRFELSAASESFTKTDKVLERIGAPWVATKENSLRNPIVALKMFKLKKEGYVMHYWAKDSEIWRPL